MKLFTFWTVLFCFLFSIYLNVFVHFISSFISIRLSLLLVEPVPDNKFNKAERQWITNQTVKTCYTSCIWLSRSWSFRKMSNKMLLFQVISVIYSLKYLHTFIVKQKYMYSSTPHNSVANRNTFNSSNLNSVFSVFSVASLHWALLS